MNLFTIEGQNNHNHKSSGNNNIHNHNSHGCQVGFPTQRKKSTSRQKVCDVRVIMGDPIDGSSNNAYETLICEATFGQIFLKVATLRNPGKDPKLKAQT